MSFEPGCRCGGREEKSYTTCTVRSVPRIRFLSIVRNDIFYEGVFYLCISTKITQASITALINEIKIPGITQ